MGLKYRARTVRSRKKVRVRVRTVALEVQAGVRTERLIRSEFSLV